MIKNVLKIILVLALIALIAFVIIMARNINIIDRYSRKVDEYQKATNFYTKIEDEYGTRELWRMDNIGITKDIADDRCKNFICQWRRNVEYYGYS